MIKPDPKFTADVAREPKMENYAVTQPQVELDIVSRAEELVKYANDRGYVLEIGTQNLQPLASGHYTQSIGVRRVRALSLPQAVAGLSNRPIPKD